MWALWDGRAKRWFNGVDGKYKPPRPKMSRVRLMIYRTKEEAEADIPADTDLEVIHIICERTGEKK